jgi:hypothetical protein
VRDLRNQRVNFRRCRGSSRSAYMIMRVHITQGHILLGGGGEILGKRLSMGGHKCPFGAAVLTI